MYECLLGLIQAQCRPSQPKTFRDWIGATFGSGMARHFMLPYNEKVWATPLELMSFDWIAERVTVVGLDAVLRSTGSPTCPTTAQT